MRSKVLAVVSSCLVVVMAVGFALYIHDKNNAEIPNAIRSHLSFVPFVPLMPNQVSIGKPYSVKYDSSNQVLSYDIHFQNHVVVFSEQSTPESFTDAPQVYSQLIIKLRGESDFDAVSGTVNVTYPVEYNGLQTAVMNSKGVLLFARPDKNLSENLWQTLFNNLVDPQ